jgi:6,7-dimethyl-8-ribityllumazine synthase
MSAGKSITTLEGQLRADGLRLGLVASRFNATIVDRLVDGAVDAFTRTGGSAENITLVRVPGAWELPQAARKLATSGRVDAVVGLGAVIRGATPHFDYVAGEAASGLGAVAAAANIPVIFGVLTTDTIEQAVERAGTKAGNKGFDAVMAAVEMCSLWRLLG